LSVEKAVEESTAIAGVCRRYGGTLAILQHPGQTDPVSRSFYRALLAKV